MVQRRRFTIDYDRLRRLDYDAVLRMSGASLGWEFLRRNADFQEDWANAQSQENTSTAIENTIIVRRIMAHDPAAERWGLVCYPFR